MHACRSTLEDPTLKFQRALLAQGSEDLTQHLVLAQAQLVAALASQPNAERHLSEAAGLIDGFPAEMKRRRSVADVRAWIAEELAKRG